MTPSPPYPFEPAMFHESLGEDGSTQSSFPTLAASYESAKALLDAVPGAVLDDLGLEQKVNREPSRRCRYLGRLWGRHASPAGKTVQEDTYLIRRRAIPGVGSTVIEPMYLGRFTGTLRAGDGVEFGAQTWHPCQSIAFTGDTKLLEWFTNGSSVRLFGEETVLTSGQGCAGYSLIDTGPFLAMFRIFRAAGSDPATAAHGDRMLWQ